jgi:hypothetical protein
VETSNRRLAGRPFHGVGDYSDGRRVVFIHRNPLDTCVSYYFHLSRKEFLGFKGRVKSAYLHLVGRAPPTDIERFCLHTGYGVEKICAFNRAWLDHLETHPDCFVTSYERLRRDPKEVLAPLLAFLEVSPKFTLEELVEQSSFEKMRDLERSGAADDRLMLGMRKGDPESAKIRKGVVKGYGEYLSPDIVERLKAIATRYGFEA